MALVGAGHWYLHLPTLCQIQVEPQDHSSSNRREEKRLGEMCHFDKSELLEGIMGRRLGRNESKAKITGAKGQKIIEIIKQYSKH